MRIDATGIVAQANDAAQKLLGLHGPAALGRPLADLIAPADPDDRELLRSLLSRCRAGDDPHWIELSPVRADGDERWLQLLIAPLEESSGASVWFLDVTEKRATIAADRHLLALMERAEQVAELGSWEWSAQTSELVWSANLYRLFGMRPGDIEPTLGYVLEQTHPDDRDRLARVTAFLGHPGSLAPVEYRILQPGRATRRLRSTITAVESVDGDVSSVFGAVEDVTDELDEHDRVASHIAVSKALDDWESLDRSGEQLLQNLAGALGFDAGTLWVPADDALVARAFWIASSCDSAALRSVTRSLRLARGACLAGIVWKTCEPISVDDVQRHARYQRREAAVLAGLRGAVAFPALHDDEILAVLELNSRDATTLSRRLMRSLRATGYELGQFLAHRRGELHPSALTPRQLEVLGLAAEGSSAREIAERLFISPSTVKSHFENIYVALGVSDRAAAVAEAMRQALIE